MAGLNGILFTHVCNARFPLKKDQVDYGVYHNHTYSLMINGEPTGLIRPTRGIRQGDSLSPYIFIISMKVLSNTLLTCSKKSLDSLVWKSIVSYRLRKGMVWRVERGNEISFWYDNWIELQNLVELLGLHDGVQLDPSIRVSEFIHNAQWNVQKLTQTLQCLQIIKKIVGIVLPIIDSNDSFY